MKCFLIFFSLSQNMNLDPSHVHKNEKPRFQEGYKNVNIVLYHSPYFIQQ